MNHWYVLRSKPRQELRAVENLERQGFFVYCPMLEKKRAKSEPLFPRYLFLQHNGSQENFEFGSVRSTRGVMTFVRFGHDIARLPDELIDDIKCQEKLQNCPPFFEFGQRVKFTEGPFKNIKAVFQYKNGEERCVVLIALMDNFNRNHNRNYNVKVNIDQLSKV